MNTTKKMKCEDCRHKGSIVYNTCFCEWDYQDHTAVSDCENYNKVKPIKTIKNMEKKVNDFSKANRFRTGGVKYADDRKVYAADADGVRYVFKSRKEAAQAVQENKYCSEKLTTNKVAGIIHRAIVGVTFSGKFTHRSFGFEWGYAD